MDFTIEASVFIKFIHIYKTPLDIKMGDQGKV